MFTVNREDVFISIPIEDLKSGIEIELGHDFAPYMAITMQSKRVEIPLTGVRIADMIDSLKEIQSQIGGKNA